jgi:DNA-binding XRE family transcriptional regulator
MTYVTERHPSGWRVLDDTGSVVKQFGPGASGASAAAQYVATLHTRQVPAFDLRSWRRSHGLTLKQLAGVLGVYWITVQRWETGAQAIPPYLHLALERLEQKVSDS